MDRQRGVEDNWCLQLPLEFVRFESRVLPPIAPGYRVFVRGPSTDALLSVLAVFEGGSPWWSESEDGGESLDQRIRERAYYLWKQRPHGAGSDALAHWLGAEQIERG